MNRRGSKFVFFSKESQNTYKPKLLRNWTVPKLNCERPRARTGKTRFIANSRGHLLPGIEKSKANPWGDYEGTWRLPKKIDRNTANQLNGLLDRRKTKKHSLLQNFDKLEDEENNIENEPNKENVDGNNIPPVPYVPGDLTEDHQRLPSHDDLAEDRFSTQDKESCKGFPNTREDFSRPLPEPEKDLSKEVEDFYKLHREMVNAEPPRKQESIKERLLSPIQAAISNFSLAKKLHKENLEHNPLPDTITDTMCRRLQMERHGKEPGLSLEDKHFATGVGWKGYPGYGPTRCTKLKVYRPKTCGHKEDFSDDISISSFDKKWRFIRQSKVTPMDLAICWDLTPENPTDEPQRTTHIDGSNGSAAPAVFSLVHTPKEEDVEPKCDKVHGCGPIFDHGAKDLNPKDYIFDRPKTSAPRSRDSVKSDNSSKKKRAKSANNLNEEDKHSEDSKQSKNNRAKSAYNLNQVDKTSSKSGSDNNSVGSKNSSKLRAKSAYNVNEIDKQSLKSKSSDNVAQQKIYQSTPDLSDRQLCNDANCRNKPLHKKLCVACELKNLSTKEKRPKSEYKMAFKAGIPQKIKSKRQDYPEHWRLATVYQHSYKPMHARKRPLLQTVFK